MPFFPLHHTLPVPLQAEDATVFREVFTSLRRDAHAWRSLASAGFTLLMQRWMADWQARHKQGPHREAIDRIIDTMHDRSDGRWSVTAMARSAHLSERRFRQIFQSHTGQTPKQFYDGLRLDLGKALLEQGALRVGEVAERLGFSSPFHFSKAYSARFNIPPSHTLAGRSNN